MIKFITNRTHKVKEVEDEIQIGNTLTTQEIDWIKTLPILGFDLETNSLDPFTGSILLVIFGNKEIQYVIDATSIDCEELILTINHKKEWPSGNSLSYDYDNYCNYLNNYRRFDKLIIGANIKFDYKFIKAKYGITFTKMYDVMIAEQRLNQGKDEFNIKYNRRTPLSAALDKIVLRRLGKIPAGMDKDIRTEFIGANPNPNTFQFDNRHIKYAANDITELFDIRIQQKAEIEKYAMGFLIYDIEFPLIRVLADAELKGLNIHENQWKDNIQRNKELKFSTEIELDNEVRELRDSILPVNDRIWLSNGRYDRERQKEQEVNDNNLFGDLFNEIEVNPLGKSKKKAKEKGAYINYDSPDQIVTILGRLKQLVPTKDGRYSIPIFTNKGKIDKSVESYTTNAKVIETYKIEVSNTPVRDFVTKLIAFRTYVTRLGTFGEEFLIKYKNKATKRFHTIYRQCHALTGRLQSGDEDNGYYNSQNIPREESYRTPFHDRNNDIITTDLSGAEAVIMIDKARDEKFYKMAILDDDAHSPLCQAVWRAIGKHRMEKLEEYSNMTMMDKMTNNFHINGGLSEHTLYTKAISLANIIVSKSENKQKRTDYKPMTFGDIYGMGIKKRAKTLGVSEEESKIAGSIQKAMIPKTYKMVADNAKFALANGYIILNTRTNSRIWFTQVLELIKNGQNIYDRVYSDIKYDTESTAKNSPVQGTQADMVKEMMVCIHREAERQKLDSIDDFSLLLQVHDELVYSCKNQDKIVEFIRDNGEIEMVTIKEFIKKWMIQVANRYLNYIKMSAEQNKGKMKTWTK